MKPDPCRAVASCFAVDGRYLGSTPLGSGHIHETWRGRFDVGGRGRSVVFQRLNHGVFTDPQALMHNLLAVTDALRASHGPGPRRSVLQPVETRSGDCLHRDAEGAFWRCFEFVEGSRSIDRVREAGDAFAAAAAFGDFSKRLATAHLALVEVIPGFHDTGARLVHLEGAAARDVRGRRRAVEPEWRQVQELAPLSTSLGDALAQGRIPTRIAHNDAKINNLLFDAVSGEVLCVIDLDTVMPGTPLFDFGDLVRTASCRAAEDESDLEAVEMDPELHAALREGFLCGASGSLTECEIALMPVAAALITFETGVRFLSDYLDGDVYFRVEHADQNLHRARCQLRLAGDIARRLRVRI